jgi:hypothetical protein
MMEKPSPQWPQPRPPFERMLRIQLGVAIRQIPNATLARILEVSHQVHPSRHLNSCATGWSRQLSSLVELNARF